MLSKYIFIFPGQGSQKVGMLDGYIKHPQAKLIIEEASDVLKFDVQKLCQEGPEKELTKTENAQPMILMNSYIGYKIFNAKFDEIKPSYIGGHSLGEYTALLAGGVFDFKDALLAVHLRGKYMQESFPDGTGGMAAVIGLDKEDVIELCKKVRENDVLSVANINAPGQVIVTGHSSAIKRLKSLAKIIILSVSAPFHSELMKNAEIKLKDFLDTINIRDSNVPVITNVDNKILTDKNDIKESLIRQITGAVLWQSLVEKAISFGVDHSIEFGNSSVLSKMIQRISKNFKTFSFTNSDQESVFNN